MHGTAGIRVGAIIALLVAAALALAGCGGDGPSTTSDARDDEVVGVYFAGVDGGLVREERLVPVGDPLRGALEELAAGPEGADALAALPAGTRLLGAGVEGDVARVDLSEEFRTGYPTGGSAAELAVVAPLVRTAAEASGAGAVLVTVDGADPAPIGSQVDFSQPLRPEDFPD